VRADIFCRVVDNYGDIGVCWRLARRLAHGHGWQVRLWVDELQAFARIQPGILSDQTLQAFDGIEILQWNERATATCPSAGDVVIEAFACDPPDAFVRTMQARVDSGEPQPVWLNLEYLSAEAWVEDCHALPSMRADGLVKHFFFPGFTDKTGGLLREPGLSAERDAMQASRAMQARFLTETLGLAEDALRHWQNGARLVSLFCYPNAPWDGLLQGLCAQARPTLLLVPEGVAPRLEKALSATTAARSRCHGETESVRVARVPFVSQPDFDRLLWCADLNFVRGEDSFVRAAWAARPLVWQIYAQDEDAHLDKLQAWLSRYPGPPEARTLIRAWNRAPENAPGADDASQTPGAVPGQPEAPAQAAVSRAIRAALGESAWPAWRAAACDWDAQQAQRADLADNLAVFCAEKLRKR
jgi:uncharacterized repeat protein (TIGR03837 family)